MPEWQLPKYAPDEYNLRWRKAAWSASQDDESLICEESSVFGDTATAASRADPP
jgi:hypothetical protein